jgi:hypothetical protein
MKPGTIVVYGDSMWTAYGRKTWGRGQVVRATENGGVLVRPCGAGADHWIPYHHIDRREGFARLRQEDERPEFDPPRYRLEGWRLKYKKRIQELRDMESEAA